ncbi:type II toxin-antitoxin system Y4mF family antitoxin [Flavobacterium aurantiibacter]|uniref:Transcriptional regulator n=1 Tax=Flavobacterium aurantiibacter TaxID=2023067 RepID=A0A255ZQ10_9FLAO|nr:type II toxin-antitoxin system Y4mF family antitoxin [Flavobacterium aurantiibacter]OYQ43667.1 transcriptional regulator [Flavobacterium aurantiibacter]
MKENLTPLSKHIKIKRKQNRLTQPELALKAGVGLRFVRDLEQGKTTLRIDKVNDVLRLFGETLGPVALDRDLLLKQDA